MKLHIKNMVCQRCIMAVEQALQDQTLPFRHVQLGEVDFGDAALDLASPNYIAFTQRLHELGFDVLNNKQSQLIESIKRLCIQTIQQNPQDKHPLSKRISEHLHLDYSHLSQIFSSVEGKTIEQYFIAQRIEKVKELLVYDEESLGEIAYQLGFSSVAHLSAQFKKVTGMTPSYFRSLKDGTARQPLDNL